MCNHGVSNFPARRILSNMDDDSGGMLPVGSDSASVLMVLALMAFDVVRS